VASTPRGLTPADSAAEIHLNLIRQLVDRRQSRTGLRLLADLQSKVDEGVVSVPVRFRFFLNKGVCYLISGDLDLAHQEFERARVLEPNNKKVLINLAQVENLRGNCEFALQLLQRALAIDPKDPNATSLRLACLHQLHRDAELDAEVASDPSLLDEPSCLYALASIAFDRGRFEQAENYARRHNEKDNQYPEAWELLGRTIIVPAQRVLQDQAAAPSLIPPVVVNASKRPRHASAAPSS
jgi:Flp pilus assembly protein TadD